METPQFDQPAIKIHRFTRRSRLVLMLTLLIAAFMRINADARVDDLAITLVIIAFLWVITYRYLNFTAALIAGLMYALSPWTIWYTHLMLLWGIHSLIFAPTLYIFLETKGLISFFCILLLLFLVFVYFIIFLHPYDARDTSDTNPLVYTANMTAGLGIENSIEPEYPGEVLASVPRPGAVWLLLLGSAALIGFPALWLKSRRIFAIVTLWIGGPVLALSFIPTFRPDELLPIMPALCLLAGAGVAWLIKLMPGKPYSRMIILSAYGVVFLSQALWWRGVLRYLEITAR